MSLHAHEPVFGYEDAKAWVGGPAHAAAVAAAAAAEAAGAASAGGAGAGDGAGAEDKKAKRRRGEAQAQGAPPQQLPPSHSRLLAFNPRIIRPGAHAAFTLTRYAHSNGLLQLWGAFGGDAAAARLPLPPAPGADGGWDAGSVLSAYLPPPPPPQPRERSARGEMERDEAAAHGAPGAAKEAAAEEEDEGAPRKHKKKKAAGE